MATEPFAFLMETGLIERIRQNSHPLCPLPTGESPKLKQFAGIRSVVFDIYGTIMISAAGDINIAGDSSSPALAMQSILGVDDGERWLQRYHSLVAAQHRQSRQQGNEFPEVEIRDIWTTLLEESNATTLTAEQAAIDFEMSVNPVWPMPDLRECLTGLNRRQIHLGIVSNAQFYTPLLFPALLGQSLEELGFSRDAMVFSYREAIAKPSRKLYSILAGRLEAVDIRPEEVLYIGNDRLKDIWPAAQEGFRTVLFAGDKRSLRWRKDDPDLTGIAPDAVITGLNQVTALLE